MSEWGMRGQVLLGAWFVGHELDILCSTDQRIQVWATRVRVPDLVVLRPGRQPEILVEPPLLIVEILSPGDSYSDLQERSRDYAAMGVETVWIVDPKTRRRGVGGSVPGRSGWRQSGWWWRGLRSMWI